MSTSSIRLLTAVPLAVLTLGLALAPSAHANFVADGQDPAGDAADGNPGRDIVGVGFAYDRRTGHLKGGVRLAAEPTAGAPANLTLFAGHRTGTGCNGFPAIGFGTQTDLRNADWVRLDGPGRERQTGAANKTYDGAIEEYEATTSTVKGQRPDCVIAQLNDPANPTIVYDTAGPYELRGLPELTAGLSRVPSVMRPGRTRTVRLTVRNRGDGSSGRVRLKVKKARGLKVRMSRSVKAIRAGKRRTVSLRVTLSSRARTTTKLSITATGKGGVRAGDERSLYLRRKKPSSGGSSGGGNSRGPSLCFRYHWLPPYSQLVPC
ncbi:MAG: CARDB domain-containing protein [Solirubrobacteraceae bacterium]